MGRYVGAVTSATRSADFNQPDALRSDLNPDGALGRQHGRLIIPAEAEAEVRLLKTVAVLYVMDMPTHLKRQDRQRDRIYRVYDYLSHGAPGTLDTMFQQWWLTAPSEQERERVIIDQIASLTESRLERLAKRSASLEGFMG